MAIILKRADRRLPEYRNIRRLYKTAFPWEERVPFGVLAGRQNREGVDFWAIYESRKTQSGQGIVKAVNWVGFVYVISYEDLSYVFYFAIDDNCRGKGLGSAALRAVRKKYAGRKLFLAIERIEENAPNLEERIRRKQFYLRNGFEELHCRLREGKMVYEVLGTEGPLSPRRFRTMMWRYFGPVWRRIIFTEIV